MTVDEIKEELEARGIAYSSSALKAELEELLLLDEHVSDDAGMPAPASSGSSFGPVRRTGGSISNLSRLRRED